MMLKKLKDILFMTVDAKSQPQTPKQELTRVVNEVRLKPRYPPFDNGIPTITIDEMIETQSELIQRIRVAFGYTANEFDKKVMAVIRNYAAYVHLLPATEKDHHNNAGGLFRIGLEVGFYALQAADGKIFSTKESAERRRVLHPKWVYATFVAGLCSEMHLPYTTMTVLSKDGIKWPSLSISLYDWAQANGSENYYVHWTDNIDVANSSSQASPIYVLSMVLPNEARDYLNEGNEMIFSNMMNSIGGMSRHSDGNVIGELVRHFKDIIIDKDIKGNPAFYGKLTVGSHLEPTVTDIMRELIKDNVWTVNTKNSRIWYTKEGCFVVWGAAFAEISSALKRRNTAGAPTSADTLADMLLKSNLIEAERTGGAYWQITLPNSPKLIESVKLSDPTLLFDKSDVDILDISLFSHSLNGATKSDKKGEKQSESKEEAKKANEATKNESNEIKPDIEQNNSPAPTFNKEESPVKMQASNAEVKKPQETKPSTLKVSNESKSSNDSISKEDSESVLLEQVSTETKRLISAIRADMQDKTNDYPVWMSARGLVISREEFESHGMPHIKVLDEMVANNWIIRDPETKRVIYRTEKDGLKINGYLINKDIAIAIGFEDNND